MLSSNRYDNVRAGLLATKIPRYTIEVRILFKLPKIHAWREILLAMPEVQQARVPELPDLFRQLIVSRNAYAQSLLS